jgi:Uma2 family endonuclease
MEQTTAKQTTGNTISTAKGAAKQELIDGKLVTKPAANRWHNIISANLAIAIGSRFQRTQCEMYVNDMQVALGNNSTSYPNIVMVQGEPSFADDRMELLKNPTVAIEIFSGKSTSTDRQQKLEGYLAVPSIKECVLVNETEMRVEHYSRQNPKQWIYRIYNERDDVISLDSINCKLSLADVYAQVKLGVSESRSRAAN